MTTFHNCGKTSAKRLEIIEVNDSIQPLQQTILMKITNYTNSMAPFHLSGNPLHRNLIIVQH